MIKLENELLSSKYTEILHEKDYGIAPNSFIVNKTIDAITEDDITPTLAIINFQNGSIDKSGVNGVSHEDLIAMIIKRLEAFQESKFRCQENELALLKLEEALLALRGRN